MAEHIYIIPFRREDSFDVHIKKIDAEYGWALNLYNRRPNQLWDQIERVFNYIRKVRAFCIIAPNEEDMLDKLTDKCNQVQKGIEAETRRYAQEQNPGQPILIRYDRTGIICEDPEAISANTELLRRSLESRT